MMANFPDGVAVMLPRPRLEVSATLNVSFSPGRSAMERPDRSFPGDEVVPKSLAALIAAELASKTAESTMQSVARARSARERIDTAPCPTPRSNPRRTATSVSGLGAADPVPDQRELDGREGRAAGRRDSALAQIPRGSRR